jgi:anhydro-N-acetylmuramic acid kinase
MPSRHGFGAHETPPMKNKGMIVAGVMSGTSADGINVALVRFANNGKHGRRAFELLGHAEYPYPIKVREAVLAAMNASAASVADLARLNFLLGQLYSQAVTATERRFRIKSDLVGCHGQTLYHQGEPAAFLGRRVSATWQTGESAIIAAQTGVPVVCDFRPADMAAGGKGAPLVPFLDYMLFRHRKIGRIVQNIGGIANLTAIPAGAAAGEAIAFDTGPGNMVVDALTQKLFHKTFDGGGKIAASGTIIDEALAAALRHEFFREKPPKTAGREEFGREFAHSFLRSCGRRPKADIIATATALTARSIAEAVRRIASKKSTASRSNFREMVLSGGGTKNPTLVNMLRAELETIGVCIRLSDEFGLPSAAKEAVAFALLAHETWRRRPSNVPSATGAKRAAVLGKICYP